MTRQRMPERRRSWTAKVRLEGQTFHVGFGEFEDGRLGEVWIDGRGEGSFTRGILGALARMASMALQAGVTAAEVVCTLKGLNFPPNGPARCGDTDSEVSSICDWIACEIERNYVPAEQRPEPRTDPLAATNAALERYTDIG